MSGQLRDYADAIDAALYPYLPRPHVRAAANQAVLAALTLVGADFAHLPPPATAAGEVSPFMDTDGQGWAVQMLRARIGWIVEARKRPGVRERHWRPTWKAAERLTCRLHERKNTPWARQAAVFQLPDRGQR